MADLNRREALSLAATVATGAALASQNQVFADGRPAEQSASKGGPLCIFAKPLQWLSFDEVAQMLDEQGWDGIEATIRPGGQVDPKKVVEQLPRLVEALGKREKAVTIMASDINSADDPLAEKVLETAAKLGLRHYRMAYYRYDLSKPILPQLDRFTGQLERLAELNHQLGMTALYQNHAGDRYFGAGLWDLYRAVAEMPHEEISVAFDIRHATAEAGMSWPVHWSMLKPHVGALYFKDFVWKGSRVENVPMGEGLVKPSFYQEQKKNPIPDVPVSIHVEYVDHKDPKQIDTTIAAYASERKTVQRLLGR